MKGMCMFSHMDSWKKNKKEILKNEGQNQEDMLWFLLMWLVDATPMYCSKLIIFDGLILVMFLFLMRFPLRTT